MKKTIPQPSFPQSFSFVKEYGLLSFCVIASAWIAYRLFDFNTSLEGDDAVYTMSAIAFSKHGGIPDGFQGPLYPIIMGLIIKLFGYSLIKLKIATLLFSVTNVFLFFAAFRRVLSKTIFIPALLLFSLNSFILKYASLTFTETLYLSVLLLFFSYVFFVERNKNKWSKKKYILTCMGIGAFAFILSLAKNLGIGMIMSTLVCYLIQKKWRDTLFLFVGFILMYASFNFIKHEINGSFTSQLSSQGGTILQKDPYDPSKGTEDLLGFVGREFENSKLYLSKHFFVVMGLQNKENPSTSYFVAFMVIGTVAYAIARAWKKKDHAVLLIGMVALFSTAITFAIQPFWDQERLMYVLLVPYLILILYGGYDFFQLEKLNKIKILYPGFVLILLLSTTIKTSKAIAANSIYLENGIAGDNLAALPLEWQAYIEMSQWAAANLPKTNMIAIRKAEVSMVYTGGSNFFPVYRSPATGVTADSVLRFFKNNQVNYFVRDALMGTMNNYYNLIHAAHPDKLILRHQTTRDNNVLAELYEIQD